MKNGISLVEMATEVERQSASKRDFIADTRQLDLTEKMELRIASLPGESYALTANAHQQVAQRLKVPQQFYDRLRVNHPDLLANTVNALFAREPERRMVRTLDGNARAFLSDRYRPLDNLDLLESIMPVLKGMGDGIRVESMQLTETRLYVKAVFPRIEGEVKKGDVVQSGMVITNSEVGLGSLSVMPLLFRLVCLNGAIMSDFGQRQYHVGKRASAEEAAYEVFSDETLRADDRAFWLKVQDTVKAAADEVKFQKMLTLAREAAEDRITGDPAAVVEVSAKQFGLNEEERGAVLRSLIEGADLSRWGLVNAVTATSQSVESYDRATELERLGGTLIELPRTAWATLAKAA